MSKLYEGEHVLMVDAHYVSTLTKYKNDNTSYFTSPIFKLASNEWQIQIYQDFCIFRGGILDIRLRLMSTLPSCCELLMCRTVRCDDLEFADTSVVAYPHNMRFDPYHKYAPSLQDVKNRKLKELSIVIKIRILRITNSSTKQIIYQNQTIFHKPIAKQSFEYKIDAKLKKQMLDGHVGSFCSEIYNKMWCVRIAPKECYQGENRFMIHVFLCDLPRDVSKVYVRPTVNRRFYSIESKVAKISSTKFSPRIMSFDTSIFWGYDLDKINKLFAESEMIVIQFDIEILEMYNVNGHKIRKNEWNQHIVTSMPQQNQLNIEELKKEYEEKFVSLKKEIKLLKQDQMKQTQNIQKRQIVPQKIASPLLLKMKHKFINNALVLTICISTYDRPNDDIPGAEIDKRTMKKLLGRRYEYKVISNTTDRVNMAEFKKLLVEVRNKLHGRERMYDGLIIIISCHGEVTQSKIGGIVTSEGKTMNIEDIKKYFNGKSLPKFVNKLKLLVLDCCRGDVDAVRILNNNHNSNYNGYSDDDMDILPISKGRNKHHPDKNMMTIYCNTIGYQTKDTKQGGYLINSLDDILSSDMIERCDLVRLGERIKRRLSQKSNQMNCAEVHSSEFDYDFYFPQNTY